MSKLDKPLDALVNVVNERVGVQWHQMPTLPLQLANLTKLRKDLREKNLFELPDARPEVELGP